MSNGRFTTVAKFQAGAPFVEAYGLLLVSLVLGQNGTPLQVVAVTAAQEGDGVTTTALNLGMMMARTGRKTLLADINLRQPDLHRVFGVDPGPGVAEVLAGQKTPVEVIRPTEIPNLSLLAAGKASVPPHALLALDRLGPFVSALRPGYDFLVFDTPAVLRFPDVLNLAPVTDGMLLVVPAEGASRRAQEEARRRLQRVDAKILGAVLNRVPPRELTAFS